MVTPIQLNVSSFQTQTCQWTEINKKLKLIMELSTRKSFTLKFSLPSELNPWMDAAFMDLHHCIIQLLQLSINSLLDKLTKL